MQQRLLGLLVGVTMTLWAVPGATQAPVEQGPDPGTTRSVTVDPQPYDAGTVRFLATSEQTGGRFAVLELVEQGGYMTPPHRHDHMDESFHVLEGVLRVSLAGSTVDYGPGSFVLIPRGVVHAQGSASDQPVRVVMTLVPGGFEAFFAGRVDLARHTRRGEPGFDDAMGELLRENARWIQPRAPDQ